MIEFFRPTYGIVACALLSVGTAQASAPAHGGIYAAESGRAASRVHTVLPRESAQPRLRGRIGRAAPTALAVDPQIECMAKVVYHEARNQPVRSQLAIAEVIDNRTHSGHFPQTYCAVANQPGQFFSTVSFRVPTASPKWRTAVSVANMVRSRGQPAVAFGALFYHSAAVEPHWNDRRRVAMIDGNIFYR